ncbi:MAG: hypothetical protein ACHQ1G_13795 [Planctomycetota bacterium]
MTKRKWLLPVLLSLPLAAAILFLGACLPVGLGDPETSRVDAALVGAWAEIKQDGTEGDIVVVLPFDRRAYLLRAVEVERTADKVELKPGEGLYKAWLTTIDGRTFLTAQPLYLREAVTEEIPGLFVAAVKLSDDGAKVEARGVDPEFPALAPLNMLPGHLAYKAPSEGMKAPSEEEARALLAKVIAENAANEKLYSVTANYRRITDKALLKTLFESVIG